MSLLGGMVLCLLAAGEAAPQAAAQPRPAPAQPAQRPAATQPAPAAGVPSPDLVPLVTKAPPAASASAAELAPLVAAPLEYTLSLQEDEWRVRVTLKPGEPQPNQLVEVLLDIGRQREGDAADQSPLLGGQLVLSFVGPGPRVRAVARPLGDAGIYGVHWTPSARGLWTLNLAPYKGDGPQVSFQIGAGVPMPASAQGRAVQASRVVVAAGRPIVSDAPGVKLLMADLGRRFLLQANRSTPDAAELKALAKLVRTVRGRVPRERAADAAEFDGLAEQLADGLDKGAPIAAMETSCLRCHLKFRDGWTHDLSRFPEVKR